MSVSLELSKKEVAFLLVLLCEEEEIETIMDKVEFPMEEINLSDLAGRVRDISWKYLMEKQ